MTATNLIVIGPSGIGKSMLLARVAERLAGRTIRGFNSASMWDGDRRIGWRLDACDDSDGGVFAHRDMTSETRMGSYGTDSALYKRIVLAQLMPIDTNAIYFIDEIGFGPESSPRLTRQPWHSSIHRLRSSPSPATATTVGHPSRKR